MKAESAVFESSHPFLFFEYFRISYVVTPWASAAAPDGFLGRVRTRPLDGGPTRLLSWPRVQGEAGEHVASLRWGRYCLGQIPLFGRVLTDAEASGWLPTEGRLRRAEAITDEDGRRVASIWRADNGPHGIRQRGGAESHGRGRRLRHVMRAPTTTGTVRGNRAPVRGRGCRSCR